MKTTSKLAPFALVSLLAGCALDRSADAPPTPTVPPTLIERLGHAPVLDVVGAHSDAEIVMRLPRTEAHGEAIPLVVDYGEASIGARGPRTLVLDHLAFAFERVDVPATRLPPRGLSFDGIRVRLVEPGDVHVAWASATEARGVAVADLELEWSMVLGDGQIHQLGSERLEDAEIALRIVLDAEGRVLADLDVSMDEVWQWAGLVELESLDAHLVARERAPTPPRWERPEIPEGI